MAICKTLAVIHCQREVHSDPGHQGGFPTDSCQHADLLHVLLTRGPDHIDKLSQFLHEVPVPDLDLITTVRTLGVALRHMAGEERRREVE